MNDLLNEFNLLSLNNQQKNLIHLESFFNNLLNYHDNNCPWIYILKSLDYKYQKEIIISSEQIKKLKKGWKGKSNQFESRLLCKMDTLEDRPKIFKELNIHIISIKNGLYLITPSSNYLKLIYNNKKLIKLNTNKNSQILNLGNSETSMLDNLRYCGLFETKDFLNEPILFGSLLNGRHRCSFVTILNGKKIKIDGCQFETDGCFESKNYILIIELKNGKNIKSFNIRQLYFPYRYIYDKIKNKKIISLFISKDKNNIIHIFKVDWKHPKIMTSIYQINHFKYKFNN